MTQCHCDTFPSPNRLDGLGVLDSSLEKMAPSIQRRNCWESSGRTYLGPLGLLRIVQLRIFSKRKTRTEDTFIN